MSHQTIYTPESARIFLMSQGDPSEEVELWRALGESAVLAAEACLFQGVDVGFSAYIGITLTDPLKWLSFATINAFNEELIVVARFAAHAEALINEGYDYEVAFYRALYWAVYITDRNSTLADMERYLDGAWVHSGMLRRITWRQEQNH